MTLQPTIDLHPELHNEFHFAENTEMESRCCGCFWRAKPKEPKEFTIDHQGRLKAHEKRCDHRARIIANQRLAKLIRAKFENDPIENNAAFERLKAMINDPIDNNGDPITTERLEKIVGAIYRLKCEIINESESYDKRDSDESN